MLLDSYGLCGEQRAHWRERLGNAGGDYAASGVAFPKRFSASVEAKSAAAKLDPLPTRRAQIIIGCPIRDTDDGQHGVVTDRSMESSEGFGAGSTRIFRCGGDRSGGASGGEDY